MSLSFCQTGSWDAETYDNFDSERCNTSMSYYRDLYNAGYDWEGVDSDPVFARMLEVMWHCDSELKLAAIIENYGRLQFFL